MSASDFFVFESTEARNWSRVEFLGSLSFEFEGLLLPLEGPDFLLTGLGI